MLKRIVRLGLLAALLSPLTSPVAWARQYHDGPTLACNECHVMHTAADRIVAPAVGLPWSESSPVGELLKKDVNDLCLSCHDDSSGAADVLGANRGRSPGDVRQAGFLNRKASTGIETTGHTLDSLADAPGSSPSWKPEDENGPGKGLNCINCHAPHGSQDGTPSYRNLRSDAGTNAPGEGLVTANAQPGSNDLSRDVYVRRALSYDESAVDFNEPDPKDSAMGRFCAGCHGEFHGRPGSANIGGERRGASFTAFGRHPVAGVDIGAVGDGWSSARRFESVANRVKVMSSMGSWDPPGPDSTPTCITCHKAHGNDNFFGLIFRSGSGTLTENGDSGGGTLEHLCGQCHGQRSVFARR